MSSIAYRMKTCINNPNIEMGSIEKDRLQAAE